MSPIDLIKKYFWYAGLAAFMALGAFAFFLWVDNHSKEKNLKTTQDALTVAQSSLTTALQVNADNLKVQQAALDQVEAAHAIANSNSVATEARDKQLRSVLDAIRNIPKGDLHPVSPVVCDVIDQLYSDGPSACGG